MNGAILGTIIPMRRERKMEAVSFSTLRKNLRAYLDKTRDDAEPVIVTSKDPSANVVVMNVSDYDNLVENYFIQSDSVLMAKLRRGINAAKEGNLQAHDLFEDDDE